jgi:hypothetical protein
MPDKKTTKKVVAKKVAQKAAVKKVAVKKAPAKKASRSIEAIANAAYLNYRRRIEQDLPGCHNSDWLEAERSLGM